MTVVSEGGKHRGLALSWTHKRKRRTSRLTTRKFLLLHLAVGNINEVVIECGINALGKVGGSTRILLIEENVKVASLVERGLKEAGCAGQ
jgi:hypothetical protein